MADEDEFPSLREELNRKTAEALARALQQYGEGLLNAAELNAALEYMWECTAGLVDKDLMDGISEAREIVPKTNVCKRVFVRTDKLAIITIPASSMPFFEIKIGDHEGNWDVRKTHRFDHEIKPIVERDAAIGRIVTGLVAKQFKEV